MIASLGSDITHCKQLVLSPTPFLINRKGTSFKKELECRVLVVWFIFLGGGGWSQN